MWLLPPIAPVQTLVTDAQDVSVSIQDILASYLDSERRLFYLEIQYLNTTFLDYRQIISRSTVREKSC